MVAAVLHLHEGAGVAAHAVEEMRRRLLDRHDVVDEDFLGIGDAEIAATAGRSRRRIFSSLPMTRATSGMAANISGSTCAPQPVTTIVASGFSRARRRIDWRA